VRRAFFVCRLSFVRRVHSLLSFEVCVVFAGGVWCSRTGGGRWSNDGVVDVGAANDIQHSGMFILKLDYRLEFKFV
jgi:hypothetical protein